MKNYKWKEMNKWNVVGKLEEYEKEKKKEKNKNIKIPKKT